MLKAFAMSSRTIVGIALLGGLALCGACSQGNALNQQAVSGSVTLDGRPLEHATIQFTPLDNPKGLFGGTLVNAGQYQITRDKGLPPGKYAVRISAAHRTEKAAVAGPPGTGTSSPAKERLPERYNSKTEIQIEVKSNGGNKFDFDMTSNTRK
jgi:hypothetical protein